MIAFARRQHRAAGSLAVHAVGRSMQKVLLAQAKLHFSHMAAAIARPQGTQTIAQRPIGPALQINARAIRHHGIQRFRIGHTQTYAAMRGVGADGIRPVGTVNTINAPGHIEPEETCAKARHLRFEASDDGKRANGRGRAPRTGGNGIAFQHSRALIKGQAFQIQLDQYPLFLRRDSGGARRQRLARKHNAPKRQRKSKQ